MTRATCEESKQLDAAAFARKGWLRPGLIGTSNWTRGGQPSGTIGWRTTRHSLVLDYAVTDWRGEKREYHYAVPVERAPSSVGGERTFWYCPSGRCSRRVRFLYLPPGGDHFLCRRCHKRSYRSQQERQGAYWGIVERLRRVEERLASESLTPAERRRLVREEWRLHYLERERLPLRGLLERSGESEHREALRAALPPRDPGRPSKQALWDRELAVRRLERQARAEAADPIGTRLARLGLPTPPVPPRPPGRPKVKRAYTRRAPFVLATPPAPNVAYCVKCRDRRPLTYRRVVKLSNGRRALQGRCSECGIKTRRLLPAAPLVA